LHRELPFVGNTVTVGQTSEGVLGEVRTEIKLSTASLLAWDGWTSGARKFIRESGDTVKISDILAKHMELVRDLYAWVAAQYRGLHRYEIAMFDELVDEYNWAISGGQEGRRRRFGVRPDADMNAPQTEP
jgi:hypothetical protein